MKGREDKGENVEGKGRDYNIVGDEPNEIYY